MFKKLLVVLLVVSLCGAQEMVGRRKKFHHHHLYKASILYYLAFLAVKVKIILLIGTVIMAMVFFGKLFALLRYGSILLENSKKTSEPIVIEKPYHDHSHHYHDSFDSPDLGHPDRISDYYPARSISNDSPINFSLIPQILQKFNFTDLTFKAIGIGEESCKKKILCETEVELRENSALTYFLRLLINSDEFGENRVFYRGKSLEECRSFYGDCVT